MKTLLEGESSVRALNADNRRDVENLCKLFENQGASAGYPAALCRPRVWNALTQRSSGKLVSITVGNATETIGHVALKPISSTTDNKRNDSNDIQLILAAGETKPIVASLRESKTLANARSVSFLGPKNVFEDGEFAALELIPSAVLAKSGWMYAIAPARETANKAMAVFVPKSIAGECEANFRSLGLYRKLKSSRDSHSWALPADLAAITALDRGAGLFAVNPSLLRDGFDYQQAPNCLLVNIFDPAAEKYIEQHLNRGYEFSGLAPRLGGIDYAVLSLGERTTVRKSTHTRTNARA